MTDRGIAPRGHRLPDATRVGRVRLQVADLERSLGFYRDQIGFHLIARMTSGGAQEAVLGAPRSVQPLLVLHEKRGARAVPRRGLLGLYHFALLLPDRAALGRFIGHARDAGIPMGAADHLVSEALYLTDPDGLQMEVYADRPRNTWQVRGREVAMAVDPLDVQGLLAAAGDVRWAGVPSGSTMGHMHFYVGDLARAEAFYHSGLGFDKVAWSLSGALFLSAGGYHHHVGVNTWAARSPIAAEDDARLLEWELVLPDPDAVTGAVRSLADAGFVAEPGEGGAVAIDPWGNRVRMVGESHRMPASQTPAT